jgi:glycine oxidase
LRFSEDGMRLGSEAGIVLDCRGFAARPQLPELRGVRGEMIRVRTPEVRLTRSVRLLHPRIPLYVVPRADGEYMIGATMIESAEKGAVSVRSALEMLSAAYALHPAFGEAEILEMSADVRPAYPDNEPRIEERDGRIFVNGFYRHGFLLAPAFAEKAADMAFARVAGEPRPGRWLVQNLSGLGEIELPSRQEDCPDPFAGLFENEADA